jgi:acetate kinase
MERAAPDKKILVINCGSSSLKYEVWQMPQRASMGRGIVERIGEPKGDLNRDVQVPDHKAAMQPASAARAMTLMKRVPENTNVVTCHLGNGASVTSIEHGKSIDTYDLIFGAEVTWRRRQADVSL